MGYGTSYVSGALLAVGSVAATGSLGGAIEDSTSTDNTTSLNGNTIGVAAGIAIVGGLSITGNTMGEGNIANDKKQTAQTLIANSYIESLSLDELLDLKDEINRINEVKVIEAEKANVKTI